MRRIELGFLGPKLERRKPERIPSFAVRLRGVIEKERLTADAVYVTNLQANKFEGGIRTIEVRKRRLCWDKMGVSSQTKRNITGKCGNPWIAPADPMEHG